MVDREAREIASSLVRRFHSGEITSDDLESAWPSNKHDKALDAIASMVWLHYDDFKPRRMTGKEAAEPEESLLLDWYAAFLDSNHEYDWPHSSFTRLAGLGALVPLSLGILKPIDTWIKARNRKMDAEMDQFGDWDTWPFRNRAEWGGEPFPPFIRN